MKKNLIALVIAIGVAAAGTTRVNAQMVSDNHSLRYQKDMSESKNTLSEPEKISIRAVKNFAATHKNVSDVSWEQAKDGFAVTFISNGIKSTVFYDKKGNWFGSIKYYSEEKMLHEIRHVVKSTYYDYNIIAAQEIETIDSHGVPTYIVNLEDKATIKLIRISGGEMSVWKEYMKAG